MTAREYLTRPEALRREIVRKKIRINTLRRFSARLTTPPREVRVQASPDPSRMQALLAEVVDEEREILLLEQEHREMLAGIALYISLLPDEKMIRLMEMRYLDSLSWEEITLRLGYSTSSVYRLHRQALSLLPPPPEAATAYSS